MGDKSQGDDRPLILQERVSQLENEVSNKNAVIEYLEEEKQALVYENDELKKIVGSRQDETTKSAVPQSRGSVFTPVSENTRKRKKHSVSNASFPENRSRDDQDRSSVMDDETSQRLHGDSLVQILDLLKKINVADQKVAILENQVLEANEAKTALQSQLEEEMQRNAKVVEELNEARQALNTSNQEVVELKSKLNGKYEAVVEENRRLVKQIEDSAKQRNQFVERLNKRGMELAATKNYQEAIELRLRAIGIEEAGRNDANYLGMLWNNMFVCWSRLQNYKKAFRAIDKSIGFNSSKSICFYNRAMMNKKLDRREQAIEDFRKALELDPNMEGAKEELAKLENIPSSGQS